LTSTDWTTFNNKQAALGFTPANNTITIATTAPLQGGGNLTANRTLSITQATTSVNGFLTSTDWNTFNGKQNTLVSGTTIKTVNGTTLLGSGNLSVGTLVATDTVSLSNRINLKLNPSDTVSLSNRINLKFNTADTTQLNLTSRFAAKLNYTDTSFLFTQSDTNQLNLSNRFNLKANINSPTFTGTVGGITKSMVGLGNVDDTSDANKPISSATQTALNGKQNTLTNPITGTGTTNTLPLFTGASTLGNSIVQQSSNNIGINTTPFASLTLGQGKNIMLDASSNNIPRILFYESFARNENDVQFGAKIQYNSPSDRLEFIMRDSFAADPSGDELAISIVRQTGNTTIHKDLTVSGNITEGGNNVLTNLDTASLSSRIDAKLSGTDTASLSDRINLKYNSSGGTISGAVTLSTTSATPTSLLGKDGSNVVGTVTTVAQTGLMTTGETTATTGSPSAVFTVTHGLGSNPSAVIITSAGIGGGDKIIFEVYTKSSTTFSVQAWNLDGTEAASKSVKIYWLAIK
jgi:hypothetical protein